MTQLLCVPPGLVNQLRPLVEPFIKKIMRRGGNRTMDDIWERLNDGRFLLWIAEEDADIKSIGITALYVDDGGRFCHVPYCAGKLDLILWGLPQLEDYARREECKRVRISGRNGWERVFKDYEMVRSTPMLMLEKAI